MAGNTCRSCPPGLVLDSNQCVCDPSQGTNIYVNGECIRKYLLKVIPISISYEHASDH